MQIDAQAIPYRDDDTELTGYLFSDAARQDRRPGLLVIHGGAGLDSHAKTRANSFAQLGFVAFACDMYGNGIAGDRQRVMARIMELRADTAKLCRRAQAGIDILASHPQVDGPIVAVGYCFGGMTVLELARGGADISGVVSVHGSLQSCQPAQPGAIKAKILVCHGALDPHVPTPHVTAFIEEMTRASADWQLIVYGNAMHGFTHEAVSQTPGVAYNALADARSSVAIKSFLAELFAPHIALPLS